MAPITKEDDNAKGSFKYCSQTESFSKEKKIGLNVWKQKAQINEVFIPLEKERIVQYLKKKD